MSDLAPEFNDPLDEPVHAPHNIPAEDMVLGACLLSPDAVDRAAELVSPADFYRSRNQKIFLALVRLRERGEPVEPLACSAELKKLGALEEIGGRARLVELASAVSDPDTAGHYAALVREAASSRKVFHAAKAVQQAAFNGGLHMHPELLDELQAAAAAARMLPGEPAVPDEPLFVDAWEFIAAQLEAPMPLWGSVEMPVIAEGSLNILIGRPGVGKTTFILDLACALAAGVSFPWTDPEHSRAPSSWPSPRPLRIAIIENEGPQEMFRAKLADKLRAFDRPIKERGGLIVVQTWAWGSFSFAEPNVQARVRRELDELEIDLVFGDPMASLGVEGVGSPAETSAFVQSLKPLGLGTSRAFLFLHHFRERTEKDEDEMRKISGAWGPHADTLLTLQATYSKDEVRLNYPKVRWAKGPTPKPMILGRVWATGSFEVLAEEGDAAHLEPQIETYLREKTLWLKATDIANAIGQRRNEVTAALKGAPQRFGSVTGQAAVDRGAKTKATVLWGLGEWSSDSNAAGAITSASSEPKQDSLPGDDFPF